MLKTDRFWNFLLLVLGAALTIYVTAALFGFVRSSSQHYALFVCAVMVLDLSGFLEPISSRNAGSGC